MPQRWKALDQAEKALYEEKAKLAKAAQEAPAKVAKPKAMQAEPKKGPKAKAKKKELEDWCSDALCEAFNGFQRCLRWKRGVADEQSRLLARQPRDSLRCLERDFSMSRGPPRHFRCLELR